MATTQKYYVIELRKTTNANNKSTGQSFFFF